MQGKQSSIQFSSGRYWYTQLYDLLDINESLRAPLGGWRDLLRVINLYLHDLLDMKERAFSGSLRDL